jgi:aminoglycoside phosphotransferase (APT) family kinase protein
VDVTGRLGLVDFDRFAWGEPEFDLASFLVEREAMAKGRPGEAFQDAVVDGFREVAGRLDQDRLALYLAHRRLARVARSAAGLRPDDGERAVRALEEVDVLLRTLVIHP